MKKTILSLLIASSFGSAANADIKPLSAMSSPQEPTSSEAAQRVPLQFGHMDSLINISGALVRKGDAARIFGMLYQKKTGKGLHVYDVFTTQKESVVGCVTSSPEEGLKVFYTDGSNIFDSQNSKELLNIDTDVVLNYYQKLLGDRVLAPVFNLGKSSAQPLEDSKPLVLTKTPQHSEQQPDPTKGMSKEDKLKLFGAIGLSKMSQTHGYQFTSHDPAKKDIFIFVSHSCPNCTKYLKEYRQNREAYDARFNIRWLPIGSVDNRDWVKFFGSDKVQFSAEQIKANESILWAMNQVVDKKVVTPTNIWKSKTVTGGVAMIEGGLNPKELDKVFADSVL